MCMASDQRGCDGLVAALGMRQLRGTRRGSMTLSPSCCSSRSQIKSSRSLAPPPPPPPPHTYTHSHTRTRTACECFGPHCSAQQVAELAGAECAAHNASLLAEAYTRLVATIREQLCGRHLCAQPRIPHLHRDWAHHVRTGAGLTPATSALGVGSPLPTSA